MQNTVRKKIQAPVLEAVLDLWRKTKGQHYISITGQSMYPLIREGDLVLVSHGCTGIRRGDVIVFRHECALIAHRVLSIDMTDAGYLLITKGDNVPYFDSPVSNSKIIGRVLAIKRGNRYVSLDGVIWRILGLLIAISTLSFAKMNKCGRNLKQILSGTYFPCLTLVLYKCEQVFSFFIRKILFTVFCKWKS